MNRLELLIKESLILEDTPFKISEEDYDNIIDMRNNGLSYDDISKKYNVSRKTISRLISKLDGDKITYRATPTTHIPKSEYQNILDMRKSGKTTTEIAKKYGVHGGTIFRLLNRVQGDDYISFNEKIPKSEYQNIIDMRKGGLSAEKIAKHYDVFPSIISIILKGEMGEEYDDYRIIKKQNSIPKSEYDNLVKLKKAGISVSKLAKKYNVATITVVAILKKEMGEDYQKYNLNLNRIKLDNSDYTDIVNKRKSGVTIGEIADEYSVSRGFISSVLKKHLGGEYSKYKLDQKIPESEYPNIIKMKNDGVKQVDIAKKYNISPTRLSAIIRKFSGNEISTPKIPINQQIVNMFKQGKSPKEISLEKNLSMKYVINILIKYGLVERDVQYKR